MYTGLAKARNAGESCIRRHRDCSGFSLLELMAAVAIASLLGVVAVPLYEEQVDKAKRARAIADIKIIEVQIERFHSDNARLPGTLTDLGVLVPADPWGKAYQYLNIVDADNQGKGKLRKDKNLVPINSDYDLYSLGKDGECASPLTAQKSQDDIVRANNGGYVGLASEY